ncbi:putative membrane protein [Pseudarthrobacter siccitolerans]|uniref:Putative membrane protein n=1 Tax=Pseudarthrobacter siccitolerans TaxID=861266 RepID=A0A024H0U7_9MICC|nr:putative membrane protein [Pseudarthrobacter siccitolerans]
MSTATRRGTGFAASIHASALRYSTAVRAWPWWLQVSAIYVIARLVSAGIFMAAALHQGPNPWFPPKPDYWNFINIWDARWYARVIQGGYPTTLPVDAAGNVQENTWAFYPLFPSLAGGLSSLTGWPPAASLTIIAMLSGLAAALVVYALFREKAAHGTALWGVAFFATFPVSAVLQVPYGEPLSLLLLAAALLLVIRRQYLWAMPVVVLLCLSRPVGVPFAATLGFLLIFRLVQRLRRSGLESHSTPDLVALTALTAVAGASALAWPAAAWAATGDIEAYTKTETVWRGEDLVPFKPWFDTGADLFGPVLGMLAPFVFVALFAAMLYLPAVVRLGVELRLWCACYMGYLVMFLHPQTSTFRMLLPLFPLALGAALLSRSKAYRGTVVVMFLLLQIVWIVWLWAWAQLPGGGDYPP